MTDLLGSVRSALAAPGLDEVENLVAIPMEQVLSEIGGVKHVYSASMRNEGMVTVQFEVGEEMGSSLVKVNDKLDSNRDKMPSGVAFPQVEAIGIDDVPIINLTLWSKDIDKDGRPDVDDSQLRMLAQEVLQNLKTIPNTSKGYVVGGRREVVKVEVLPEILAGYGISLRQSIYDDANYGRLTRARSSIAQADAEFDTAWQDFLLRTAQRYFDMLTAIDGLRFAQAEALAVRRQADRLEVQRVSLRADGCLGNPVQRPYRLVASMRRFRRHSGAALPRCHLCLVGLHAGLA